MPSDPSSTRILIFGGTFDPPHRAHVELPQRAAKELGGDRIIYIPAAINPLKAAPGQPPPTPAHHRLAMLKLALRDSPRTEISEIELERAKAGSGPSYTIDTLRELTSSLQVSKPASLFLLIGADQALEFHHWKEWQEILKLAQPAVMLRPPWTRESFTAALRERYDEKEAQWWLDRTLRTLPLMDVSATEVRRFMRDRRPHADRMDVRVEEYALANGLYAT